MNQHGIIYVVSSRLLCRAAQLLQPPERMCFVTGIKLFSGSVIVLTELVEVSGLCSRVHVIPDPGSVLRAQQQLLCLGMDIEGQFHTHPGTGLNATQPSPTDIDTARRWETGAAFLG